MSRALVSYYFPTRAELLAAALAYAEVRAIDEIGNRTGRGTAPERIEETLLLEIDDSPAVRDHWIIWSEMTDWPSSTSPSVLRCPSGPRGG